MFKAQNKNVAQVFGWTVWDNAVAIIMEYMPAGNLWEFLDNNWVDVTPLLSLRICKEIADGIAFLHGNVCNHAKLIHGDIKAENIFLTENLNCKIGDFGSAQLSVFTGKKTRTYVKAFNLTPKKRPFSDQYAAPELLNDPGLTRTPYQDVYAYGIIIFEVLERRRPIQANNLIEAYIINVKNKERPQIAEEKFEARKQSLKKNKRNNEIEILDTLVKIMKKCWAHDPVHRPSMNDNKQNLEVLFFNHNERDFDRDVNEAKQHHVITTFSPEEFNVGIFNLSPPAFYCVPGQGKMCN